MPIFIASNAFFAYIRLMQPDVSKSASDQKHFDDQVKASSAIALRLKRFGVEMKAVANGDSVTSTGRMLTMVKKRFSSAFAFLSGSNNLLTQLALADSFTNNANLGNVWSTLKNWGANFSQSVDTNTTQSPKEIVHEFAMEAACKDVIAELQAQELAFESDLETEMQSVFHEAGDFIGPLQELEHVHARLQNEHGLKQLFNPDGLCTYAHCANKVTDLKAAFATSNTQNPSIASPSHRVMVYNTAASADKTATAHAPSKPSALSMEATHLEPKVCPA